MIYVDHAATSPTHPKVVEAMLPFFTQSFGNPSSIHQFGRKTREVLNQAREAISQQIGVNEKEIIFTSGGTEADNTALLGVMLANRDKGNHLITTEIEHPAVLKTCQFLESIGFDVTYLPVNQYGRVSVEDVKKAVKEQTVLVSVMYGNNEVGTIQPIQEIGQFLHEQSIYFHTDAVQAFGINQLHAATLKIDLMSVSAHKFNGPKGIGFLYIKEGIPFTSFMHGGDQERKRRGGTENLPAIVGMVKAAKLAEKKREDNLQLYASFRQILLQTFKESGIRFVVNGDESHHLPHILNVSFLGVKAEVMLVNLDLAGIAASSGSACTAGASLPSHVLVSMFQNDTSRIESAIRFSFGYGNTEEEIHLVAKKTVEIVKRLQK